MSLVLRPRLETSRRLRVAVPIASVAVAVAVWSILLVAGGKDPVDAFGRMARGAFGTSWGLSETLVRATPLLLCAASVALAATMSLWNVGAQGQLLAGAIAASWVALQGPSLPPAGTVLLMFALAMAAGALWATFAGALKAWLDVDEILTTLMLNYVAADVVLWLVQGPWRNPRGNPESPLFPPAAELARLGFGRLHVGAVLAPILVLALALAVRRSVWGYELRVIGDAPATARYGGIRVRRRVVAVMAVAGALAGLAGAIEVAGLGHKLHPDVAPGYGYTAILVCWLARKDLLGLVPAAVLFAGLLVAGEELQVALGLPAAVVKVLQALVVLALLAGDILVTHRLALDRKDPS